MSRFGALLAVLIAVCLFISMTGCERDPLDPIQIGRFRPTPVVNIILDSLGVAEEEEPKFVDAEDPKPIDLLELEQDYVLSPGDIIVVQIFELLEEATPYAAAFEISESGNISIPEVGTVQAAGLTELQLEEEIKQILSPTILKSPSVTVRTDQSPSRSFTILGEGLPRPGRYLLPGYTYRLADALAEAGSPRQFNVSYIYVTRYESPSQVAAASTSTDSYNKTNGNYNQSDIKLTPVEPQPGNKREELLEIIAPLTSKNGNTNDHYTAHSRVITAAESATFDELKELAIPEDIGFQRSRENNDNIYDDETSNTFRENSPRATRTEWIFKDGKWVAVEVETDQPMQEETYAGGDDEDFTQEEEIVTDWPEIRDDYQTRVIRIPVKSLGVDPRYNIVIRPRDIVTVPFNVVGEAVVMGNVNRQGYIDLTGRPMTLIQAIAAAGGLSELAEPSRVEVRRRVGEDREQIVMVDLDKIAKGLQPDFFIKENDTINVGTLPSSRFAAVLRNAFRATYGFGFIYDRNFADRDFLTRDPIPGFF